MRFLENLKEFNGLLTYLPLFDMNSPFPVIKVLDMLQDEKLPNNKIWSKIRCVLIEEPSSLQHPFIQKTRIPEGFHGIICWVFCSKNQPFSEVPFLLEGLPFPFQRRPAMPEGFHGKMASRMDLPKRSGVGLGVIAGKPRAEHPKLG